MSDESPSDMLAVIAKSAVPPTAPVVLTGCESTVNCLETVN